MIPANSGQKKKRKQEQVDDGNIEEDSNANSNVLLDIFERDTQEEGNINVNAIVAEPATLQINLSSSSSSSDSNAHHPIGITLDSMTGLNIPNDNSQSNTMDRVELPAENTSQFSSSRTGRPPIPLYLTCDDDAMSPYQCFVRKQIELFEADFEDVDSNAQGRNKPIVLGQVGIRCRYCNRLPPNQRKRGATYYPSKLDGIYQAANNLAIVHLGEYCENIDEQLRNHLATLRSMLSIGGGGKKIWAERAANLGVFEDVNGLRFEPTINYRQRNYLDV